MWLINSIISVNQVIVRRYVFKIVTVISTHTMILKQVTFNLNSLWQEFDDPCQKYFGLEIESAFTMFGDNGLDLWVVIFSMSDAFSCFSAGWLLSPVQAVWPPVRLSRLRLWSSRLLSHLPGASCEGRGRLVLWWSQHIRAPGTQREYLMTTLLMCHAGSEYQDLWQLLLQVWGQTSADGHLSLRGLGPGPGVWPHKICLSNQVRRGTNLNPVFNFVAG